MAVSQSLLCLFVFIVFCDGRYFRNDYKYDSRVDGWIKLHEMPTSWEEARIRCFFEGAVLASPLNANLLTVMKAEMTKHISHIFTGISTIYSDYFSVEGVPLEIIPKTWAPGEPNHHRDDGSCVAIGMFADGNLLDIRCDDRLPFICYKKNSQDIPTAEHCGTVDPAGGWEHAPSQPQEQSYGYTELGALQQFLSPWLSSWALDPVVQGSDPGYVFEARTGHCYKFHRFGQSWSRAFMACSAEGGYLAVINSEVEAQVFRELMAKYSGGSIIAKYKDYIAIGFHDWSQHGVFMTVQGQTLKEAGYEKWARGQPDNATTGEYCGAIFRDALLIDIWCEDTLPFICEKTPGSLLDHDSGSTVNM